MATDIDISTAKTAEYGFLYTNTDQQLLELTRRDLKLHNYVVGRSYRSGFICIYNGRKFLSLIDNNKSIPSKSHNWLPL